MREGDEVQVHCQQHQFDGHQQDDDVLTVQENTDHRDREQDRAEDQVMSERQSHGASFLASAAATAAASIAFWFTACIFTMRRRSLRLTLTARAGSMALVSLRLRRVRATAAMIATSRIRPAISKP